MNRCRVSEEDKTDPYFNGEEGKTDPAMNGTDAERERFEDILGDIQGLVFKLYRNKHFKPDEDDFEAAVRLYYELKYHTKRFKK
jgi:hypothetical protein